MPHWDCLNVFTNVIQKPIKAILNEFSGVEADNSPTGDVKYHLSTNYTWPTPSRKKSIPLAYCQPILWLPTNQSSNATCILFQFCAMILDGFITPSIFQQTNTCTLKGQVFCHVKQWPTPPSLDSWSCFRVTEDWPLFALVKLIATSTNILKSCIYFNVLSI